MSQQKNEVTDGLLNSITHTAEIKELTKKTDDFEKRIRDLEAYKNHQEGFLRANLHWFGYAFLIVIQIVVAFLRN